MGVQGLGLYVTNPCNGIGQYGGRIAGTANFEQGKPTSWGLICSLRGRRVWEMEHCDCDVR